MGILIIRDIHYLKLKEPGHLLRSVATHGRKSGHWDPPYAAEEASKEAAERMGYETGITFDQLARNPDDYEGQKVKFTGKVLQVIEGSGTKNQIRMSTKGNWDNVIYCEYEKSIVSSRILEDDKITIYGRSAGLLSYESTGSGVITLPSIIIDKIEQK